MLKKLLTVSVFFIAMNAAFAQNTSPLPQMDTAIGRLAGEIGGKLAAERAQKAAVAQFTFEDGVPPLAFYWVNHLTEELTRLPGKSFTLLSGGAAGADWIISGEIIEMAGVVRVYTRLVRAADRTIAASFHSDFEQNEYLLEMLSPGGSSSPRVMRDAHEPDTWDNPVPVEPGENEQSPLMSRTLHNEDDEDFFVFTPARDGRLVMETTGSLDTTMEFFDAEAANRLAENDDGASGNNARIRHNVQAGKRYIAKVKGYSDDTGQYGFRAYMTAQSMPDEHESDNDSASAKWIDIGTPQQHNFHSGDDVDWVKFQVSRTGRYIIRARGVNSTSLDTVIELFDSGLRSIGEDDDGGEGFDSRLSMRLESGLYFLSVECLDDDPDEPYTISIEAE